jgi:hypothetical protein
MKLKVIYNLDKIKIQLSFIEKNLTFFKRNKMFFYFPFESIKRISKEDVDKQILKDEKYFQIRKKLKILEKKWKQIESTVFDHLLKYNKKEKALNFRKEYECLLSFYGCYGYYNFPNEIFINVDAKTEFIIETIIHELIHLMVYKNTRTKSYEEIEKIVDKIFVDSGLSKIFQKYKVQKI